MINPIKFFYQIGLFALLLLLTNCGSQEFVDDALGRMEQVLNGSDDTSNYPDAPLPKSSRNSSIKMDAPDQALKDGFTCDGGREIAIHFINDGYCDCEDGTDEKTPCETLVEDRFLRSTAYCTGGNVNMRSTPEIIDNVVGRLEKNQAVIVLDEITGNDPNVGVMNRSYDWHPWDGEYDEDAVVKLRKNQAVRIVRQRSSVLDVSHADQSLDLVDLSITSKGKVIVCYGVPRRYINSYYGQTWYKVETKEGQSGWVSGDFIEFD